MTQFALKELAATAIALTLAEFDYGKSMDELTACFEQMYVSVQRRAIELVQEFVKVADKPSELH
jgi:hypothetical protein